MQMRDPRVFFLTVLLNRIQQVCQEWEEVVKTLSESVREYDGVGFAQPIPQIAPNPPCSNGSNPTSRSRRPKQTLV